MKKTIGFKLLVGSFLLLTFLNACLIPCAVTRTCRGGGLAWCETWGQCLGRETCTTVDNGVFCSCMGASRTFTCEFIN
jgi:hypothetical protein